MLTLSAADISKAIRDKKKKRMESPPEFIDTSPVPDMNAQDIYDIEQKGRVESELKSPPKINADKTMADEPSEEVMKMEREARMGRLKKYFDGMSLSKK